MLDNRYKILDIILLDTIKSKLFKIWRFYNEVVSIHLEVTIFLPHSQEVCEIYFKRKVFCYENYRYLCVLSTSYFVYSYLLNQYLIARHGLF